MIIMFFLVGFAFGFWVFPKWRFLEHFGFLEFCSPDCGQVTMFLYLIAFDMIVELVLSRHLKNLEVGMFPYFEFRGTFCGF